MILSTFLQRLPLCEECLALRLLSNSSRTLSPVFFETALEHTFQGVPYNIAQYEPLAEAFSQADIVVSHYSTTTLEALQCGKPLIYFGVSPGFELMAEYHLALYGQKGALIIAKTREELAHSMHTLAKDPNAREQMSRAATVFLEKYAFDGS
jgi:UDP-N-acetylglucosamine:LPS N-acetylglucosamine transferase